MTLTDISRRLNLRHNDAKRRGAKYAVTLPRLILMTDAKRLPDPLPLAAQLPRGSAVILRHYEDPKRDLLSRSLATLCKKRRVRLLVAGDARLALKIGADGLYLPETQIVHGPNIWRCWRRPSWIIIAAAHSRSALWRAKRAGADAALLSPVFKTDSHPQARQLGPLLFLSLSHKSPLPVYALGGVNAANAARLVAGGCAGIAAIGGFLKNSKGG